MKKNIPIYFLAILLFSCSLKNNDKNKTNLSEELLQKDSIELTGEQIKQNNIKTGYIKRDTIPCYIECSGTIEILSQNTAVVSTPINGFIKQLFYYSGDYVKAGSVLAIMQHPDFIKLQQQYLEAKIKKEQFEEEFKRQGELTIENASSIKKMQKAQTDYLINDAIFRSLKLQLELIGVDLGNINKEEFVSEFKIKAPISGYISQLNANQGKYLEPKNCIVKIVNTSKLQICLSVPEEHIHDLKNDREIKFRIPNNKDSVYTTKVNRIGNIVDKTNKDITVTGHIKNNNKIFKPGMSVNSLLYTNERDAFTLPAEAIVKFNNESFIFIKKDNLFKRIKIEKGVEQDNFCEILNLDKELLSAEIVIKGAYYLMAEMKAEE